MEGRRLSFREGLTMDREGLMVSSSAGMVLVSNRQGTVPFSFSSSIWKRPKTRSGVQGPGQPSLLTNTVTPLNKWDLWERR